MTDWLKNRTLRERILLAVAGVVAGISALHVLVLSPSIAYWREARAELEEARALQRDILTGLSLLPDEREAQTGPAPSYGADAGSVRAIVSREAATLGLQVTRLQPDGDAATDVWFAEADPLLLNRLIVDLSRTMQISAAEALITRTDKAVQAHIRFTREGQ